MNSIYHRVSIRRFQDRPVEKEKTEAILRAAMQAPSAANQQPWEFYVVTNREKIRALAMSHPYARAAEHAPAVIVPVYRKDCAIPAYAEIDLAIAVENMWLETDAQGLGGVWMGIAPLAERMEAVEKILDTRLRSGSSRTAGTRAASTMWIEMRVAEGSSFCQKAD